MSKTNSDFIMRYIAIVKITKIKNNYKSNLINLKIKNALLNIFVCIIIIIIVIVLIIVIYKLI